MNTFVEKFRQELDLNQRAASFLSACDISNLDELLNLLYAFPSVSGEAGINVTALSEMVMARCSRSFKSAMGSASLMRKLKLKMSFGAKAPDTSPYQKGTTVRLPSATGPSSGRRKLPAGMPRTPIDFHQFHWPVRDQDGRGTCVAFATVACREYLEYHNNSKRPPNLSEQYLYWATKTKTTDPYPDDDGTRIQYSQEAICKEGTCLSSLWPYDKSIIRGNVTHARKGVPSKAAIADAKNWRCAITNYSGGNVKGKVKSLCGMMQRNNKPLAISLPVFEDPVTKISNWSTPLSWLYGKVENPPPYSVTFEGHAVCVTGFQPDPNEPSGGYFIIRNSWGRKWGSALPSSQYYPPEPGYGQISASYVNKYLYEICCL